MKAKQTLSSMFSVRGSRFQVLLASLLLFATSAFATVRYVDVNSTNATPPYTNWAAASTNIQLAVDVAASGDEVVVMDGVYTNGGRAVGTNLLVNRVAVDKALALRSVNGPQATVIQGLQVPGITNGNGACRCVYLTDGATLSGFTLTHGATRTNGDYRFDQSGGGVWCVSTNASVTNCLIIGNSACNSGGGISGGTLDDCALTGNSARNSGGADSSTLNNCTLAGNSASFGGGGATGGTLTNCTLTGNWGYQGGGASYSTLNNSTLTGNYASYRGGGAYYGTLRNCALTGNAADAGGGMCGSTLYHCTVAGNSANCGGGAYYGTLTNCIVYFNTGTGPNYYSSTLSYCCTTPLPTNGVGNIIDDPRLASAAHLSVLSPCRGVGNPAYTRGVDIDGEAWANPPSIGCDEYHAEGMTGPLSVDIAAAFTNVAINYSAGLTAQIEGRPTLSIWEFEDGTLSLNESFVTRAWAVPGDYVVTLWVFNDSYPKGVSATATMHVVQGLYYVAVNSAHPVPPYTSWATAATNLQDGVDAASAGGSLWVTNGVYRTGGRAVGKNVLVNRVAVDKPLTLRSVNGPQFTIIQGQQVPGAICGDGAIRCAYLTNGACLSGFTLTNGATHAYPPQGVIPRLELQGGGVWCESAAAVVSNGVLAGNAASATGGGIYSGTLYDCMLTNNWTVGGLPGAGAGGGASASTLSHCTLTGNHGGEGGGGADGCLLDKCTLIGNWCGSFGGGASGGILNNCLLTGNYGAAAFGTLNNCTIVGNKYWGVWEGTLNNCIVYYNDPDNYRANSNMNYCCTTPTPPYGVSNFTKAPLMVDYRGGNFRLQSNSPCINAGCNAYVSGATDMDGRARIVGATVDVGAYEFQPGTSSAFIGWLQQHGLPTDGSADHSDSDGDGMDNWQEWVAGTDPTNAASLLRLQEPVPALPGLQLRWNSDTNHIYFVQCTTNLDGPLSWSLLETNIPGQAGTTTFTDTGAPWLPTAFYRVGTDSTNGSAPLWLEAPQFVPGNVTVTWTSVTNRSYVVERSAGLSAPLLFTPVANGILGQAGTTSYTDTGISRPGTFFYRVGVGP